MTPGTAGRRPRRRTTAPTAASTPEGRDPGRADGAEPDADRLDSKAQPTPQRLSDHERGAGTHAPEPRLLLLLGGMLVLGGTTVDLYLPSVPEVARELGTTAAAAQSTISAGLIGVTMRRTGLGLGLAAIAVLAAPAPATAAPPERADVMVQGGGAAYASNGARVVRQPDGLAVSVKMPTPEPGAYVYPDGTTPGHPEVFTLWMFIFNHPEECTVPCDMDDTANPAVKFGAYNAAGHVTGGGTLNLAGRIGVGETAGAPPGITPHDLSNPAGAEIHLAVTSHGGLDPATLPGEFSTPTGSPACGCWWVAIFD